MPKEKEQLLRRAKNRDKAQGRRDNDENAPVRIAQFGQYWQPMTISQYAKGLGLRVNFANWETSETGKKAELRDSTGNYTFVMDSTKVYYRVMRGNHYVNRHGQAQHESAEDDETFMRNSHFKNKSS